MRKIEIKELPNHTSILENDIISLVILPKIGGKIISLIYKEKGFELTGENYKDYYIIPNSHTHFSDADASGFDDAFPTINPCKITYSDREYKYTDHGEIWRKELLVDKHSLTKTFIEMDFISDENPYRFYKSIELKKNQIKYKYKITNTSNKAFPCLFTLHNLVRYEEDMEIIYPRNAVNFINVNSASKSLGSTGEIYELKNPAYDFNKVPGRNSNSVEKYYVNGKIEEGYCGYCYPGQGVKAELIYDSQQLPYLGFWITTGGFRGDYNCALEPSNGFYDGVEMAKNNNSIYILEPDKPLEIEIVTRLTSI